jgi:hypothetical protein
MADHVPFGIFQISESSSLAGKFLHAILAERPKSSPVSLADALRSESLAYRHERDFFGIPPGAARSGCNQLAY